MTSGRGGENRGERSEFSVLRKGWRETDRKKFGRFIKKYRHEHGMSLEKMADVCGLTPATIHNIETGRRSPKEVTVFKICRGIGMSFEELGEKMGFF